MPASEPTVRIGIDIGGTNLRAALVRPDGGLAGRFVDTPRQADIRAQLDLVTGDLLAEAEAAALRTTGLGIAIPGSVDPATGTVASAPNAPDLIGWGPGPLGGIGAADVRLFNDANAALLAEWRVGAASGAEHVVGLFVGTGIGGAVIIGGRLLIGAHGVGAELGHLPLDAASGPGCGCGGSGCLEQLSSGTAIARRYAELRGSGAYDAAAVAAAAMAGDGAARQAFAEAGRWLGTAVAGLANIFDPEVVVIGGGVSAVWDLFEPAMTTAVRRHAMPAVAGTLRVVRGTLGRHAGVVGTTLDYPV
jgi:glucokinase